MSQPETFESPNLQLVASDLKFLKPSVVALIEKALSNVGPFGEVQLVIEKGHLRYIRTLKSEPVEHIKL